MPVELLHRSSGRTLREEVVTRVSEVDGVLLGPVSHYDYPPRAQGGMNPSGELRTRFKLYSNIRPCKSRADLTGMLRRPMDLIIVRENTEGFYSDRNMFLGPAEFMPDEDTALSIRKITAKACAAVAQTASNWPATAGEGHRRAQGERAEAVGWIVPPRDPQGRRTIS